MSDGNPKILVVDDEAEIVELLKEAIEEDLNCKVMTASHGGEAIELLKLHQFSAIVSDYNMPFVNGGELFIYNSSGKNTPFIFVSAAIATDKPELKNFNSVNPLNTFLTKPVNYDQLIDHLKVILKVGE